MKRAILSDVHGNLEALEAVLGDLRDAGAGEIWSLGDAVGYGPDPERCVEILREEAAVNLMGNHDAAVVDLTPVEHFNINARRAVEWTRSVVGPSTVKLLEDLPYTERREEAFLVHASPRNPEAWDYIMSVTEAEECFTYFEGQTCFVGHTHVPFFAIHGEGEKGSRLIHRKTAKLRDDARYLINVGSVGQPRDLDPRASYVMFDAEEGRAEIRRVTYPLERTQAKMREHGLPSFLVERLAEGR
jgi:diadenosine tetraphosphatase ApaH/serine/threonine PP2A family protein phosphatase